MTSLLKITRVKASGGIFITRDIEALSWVFCEAPYGRALRSPLYYMKCADLHIENNVLTPTPMVEGGGQLPKNLFVRNCMECADQHRKILFRSSHFFH